ncbi:ATP-binding protein [Niveibacterium sp.]|uniref:ATP-binding protein n=1 Tax=Niveibacterium sp. TaxID=2017444 RepID=UPI0035B36AFB
MEVRERFFDKFVTAGKREGTGLGTYSARMLIEALHGQIAMETSDSDNTTTIHVEVPAPPAKNA